MSEFISNYGMYILYIGGALLIAVIVWIVQYKLRKNKAGKFLEENPDAAKIFLTSKALVVSEAVSIHLVNGEAPVMFSEKGYGFYAKPGTVNIQISYTYTRPGVMYKNVTESTGAVEQEIEVEANKSYKLSFDRKKEEFVFEEI